MRKILIIFIISICCGACVTLQELVDYPTVHFDGMSVKDMSLFESTVVFNFKISNPNPMGFMITHITYNLFINKKKFIKGISDKDIRIKPGESSVLELPVTFNHLDLFDSVEEFMKSDIVFYELSGNITVGPFVLAYQTGGDLNLPRMPDISLENIQISDISGSGAKILISIGFDNTNPFSVRINELEYQVTADGVLLCQEKTNHIPLIGKNKKTSIDIPVSVRFRELGQAVGHLLTKSSVSYEFKGKMNYSVSKIGEKTFPFHSSGAIRPEQR